MTDRLTELRRLLDEHEEARRTYVDPDGVMTVEGIRRSKGIIEAIDEFVTVEVLHDIVNLVVAVDVFLKYREPLDEEALSEALDTFKGGCVMTDTSDKAVEEALDYIKRVAAASYLTDRDGDGMAPFIRHFTTIEERIREDADSIKHLEGAVGELGDALIKGGEERVVMRERELRMLPVLMDAQQLVSLGGGHDGLIESVEDYIKWARTQL